MAKRKVLVRNFRKATASQIKEIKRLHRNARSTPMIAFSSYAALNGRDASSVAWETLYEYIDSVALKCGYPKRERHYGFNTQTGEIVQ